MEIVDVLSSSVAILFTAVVVLTLYLGIKIVPQSQVFVIERFGKYTKTLTAGLSIIVPYLDRVGYKVSILERQLPEFTISVITRDNVEVRLETTVFYRVVDASRSVYRIQDVGGAIHTAASSIVRSAAGKLELDDLQSSRESMNAEIATFLQEAAEIWGIEITRTEITDVIIDDQTKEAQRQQLNAERERRAAIARAEGEKRSIELAADAKLYEAEKIADAVRIEADASAYAIKINAEADAEQTRVIGEAIEKNGQAAVNFEIMKRQVEAIGMLAAGESTKTIIMPTEVTGILGGLETLMSSIPKKGKT
ncbi:SPFH domain-containing protein [Candidatus Puniceispirillum marinum]|uniref:Band 7 protein n=1 Tax=Puniceispirillum marinum (strain IMCC1322) TaxID=488538 RepID=D5BN54_PUNMI|nr:SPFH domain-containing protein [Candidatus Puniceispirillum marinum]ADE40247.1 band 7 protein [Candidatus Puniceispirillum marinum IMCC1322]